VRRRHLGPDHRQGSAVLGKYNGTAGSDYWTVTERDGTEYWFGRQELPGWKSGDALTNSADTMPVYSAHSGDPCYSSTGFTSSACTMVYAWHLDYTQDTHSQAMAYYYTQTTNYYGEDGGASNVSYVSDSYLTTLTTGSPARARTRRRRIPSSSTPGRGASPQRAARCRSRTPASAPSIPTCPPTSSARLQVPLQPVRLPRTDREGACLCPRTYGHLCARNRRTSVDRTSARQAVIAIPMPTPRPALPPSPL
jgi:hypothetical protein